MLKKESVVRKNRLKGLINTAFGIFSTNTDHKNNYSINWMSVASTSVERLLRAFARIIMCQTLYGFV